MSVKLDYKDTISIVDTQYNGYGDETGTSVDIKALFLQSTGFSHSGNTDNITADAHAYLDPENTFLKSKGYRLEGMLLKANLFGEAGSEAWYRINIVRVGMDKLLTNKVDNVHVYLTKSRGI